MQQETAGNGNRGKRCGLSMVGGSVFVHHHPTLLPAIRARPPPPTRGRAHRAVGVCEKRLAQHARLSVG